MVKRLHDVVHEVVHFTLQPPAELHPTDLTSWAIGLVEDERLHEVVQRAVQMVVHPIDRTSCAIGLDAFERLHEVVQRAVHPLVQEVVQAVEQPMDLTS